MTTLFSTFPGPPPQSSIQFISYEGPPKQTPRRIPSKKVPSSEEEFPHIDTILGIEPDSNDEWEKREEFVHTAHGVTVVDLTCSVDEANCETGGSGGESDDVGDLANKREGISMPTSQEDTGRASDQSVSSGGNSQGNAVVIDDSQSDLEADSSDSYEDPALHIDDRLTSPSTLIPEYRSREVPTGTIDTINSETADGAPASELKQIALPSTSSKSSSMVMKQSAHGRLPTIDIMSSSSRNDSDSDSNDMKGNCTTLHYQKRSSAAQGHIKKPNTTSNQPFKHNARPAKRRKPLPPNRPSSLNHLSAVKSSVHIANTGYSNDSSDRSDSSDDSSYKSPPNIASKRSLMSIPCSSRLRGQKRKRSQNNVDEEEEYEVENILDSRIYRRKLQYRAKWLGYPEDDPVWYDARNFKNSPHRLGEFYKANPFRPGPPERLGIWTQCWEEDRDAEDHPDDNKPKRLSARGGEL